MTTSSAWDALFCSACEGHRNTCTHVSTKSIPAWFWFCFFRLILHRKTTLFSSLFPSLEISVFYLHYPHCCLPVEDEGYDCNHDNADTQNDHDPILQIQPWGQTSTLMYIEKKPNNEISVFEIKRPQNRCYPWCPHHPDHHCASAYRLCFPAHHPAGRPLSSAGQDL